MRKAEQEVRYFLSAGKPRVRKLFKFQQGIKEKEKEKGKEISQKIQINFKLSNFPAAD